MAAPQVDVDVVVIGAGPVGLTLANELARREVRVAVIDRGPGIREISKALIWHVRTQEALGKVGIMEAGVREAQPLREVSMHAYGERIGSWSFDAVSGDYPHPLIIGQNRTQHLLLDLLASRGTTVDWSTEATSVDLADEHVTVTATAAGATREIRARYVIGCEGSNSIVRKRLGLSFEGERYSGEQFIQADCKIAWNMPRGRSYLFLTDAGYMMVIEMPGNLVRIFISLPDHKPADQDASQLGAVEDTNAAPSIEEITTQFERLSGMSCTLSGDVWRARYRTSHRVADSFGVGRAYVAGDAGHVHVPIGGQGMNTGIQDAFNLGWKLAGVLRGWYPPTILATYNEERLPVAQSLIRGTDRSYRGILHPSELQQRVVRMFGPFVVAQAPVQRALVNTLEELTIGYADSALNASHTRRGGPAPGHRVALTAPVVRRSDGATRSLAQIARECEWLLLSFAGVSHEHRALAEQSAQEVRALAPALISAYVVSCDPNAPPDGTIPVLVDGERHAHEAFAARDGALALLRPDDVVAGSWRLDDVARVRDYVSGVFA